MRVAMLSVHACPMAKLGGRDSGGMNVYIRSVAERLAGRGMEVDVFTRCRGRNAPEVEEILPGHRLIQIQAGPCAAVPKDDLPRFLPAFLGRVLERQRHEVPEGLVHHDQGSG